MKSRSNYGWRVNKITKANKVVKEFFGKELNKGVNLMK